ncbi:hypothetical protein ACXR6G_19800 [Ancylomarina sp. YFZ004]
MSVTPRNWKNTNGIAVNDFDSESWKQHWMDSTGRSWPKKCSVASCSNEPTLGAHVINDKVNGAKIVPMCPSCYKLHSLINLSYGISLVSADIFDPVINDPLGIL